MIYIENNLKKQDVFVPRNDTTICYVSPYDKGYQDGYEDGLDDCGAGCTLQEKEVTVTATTQTVRPDDGYVGMDMVNINASQFVLEKYTEGYHDGEENGTEEQKSKLASTAFTQNGVYRREDGWNEVEVAVEQTGTTCNLESKTETVTANTQTILPSSGYDGMSEVVVDATNYGQDKYDEGFADGQASVPPCPPCPPCPEPNIESGVTFPLNSGFTQTTVTPSSGYDGIGDITIYDNGYGQERYDNGFTQGYAQGQADCPSCPEIESAVTYGIGSGFTGATITPSSGYDGMAEVTITDNGYGQEKYDEGHGDGYNEGFTDGQTDILSGMTATAFTQNDTYTNANGWSAVTVNVPQTGSSCNLETKNETLTASTQTFVPSSGYDGMSSVSVDASSFAQDKYDEGYQDGLGDCPAPNLEQKSIVLTATSETVLPSSGYDGMSSVEVDASNMVADLYNEGYEDGYDDGRTLNLQHKNATQTATTQTHYPDNTNGSLTIIGEANILTNFIPYTAYTGNSNYLRIEIDNVWNGRKGSDQYLYTVLSGDTRFSCERFRIDNYPYLNIGNTTGLGTGPENGTEFHTWAVVLDNGTVTSYIDGVVSRTGSFVGAPSNTALVFAPPTDARNLNATFYSVKFKDANGNLIAEFVPNNHNGGAIKDTVSNTIYDKTGSGIVTFNAGYDGMSAITVDASGLCQNYYNSGYTDGQSSVSCNLETASYGIPSGFTGTTLTPSSGYDGMSAVAITDGGYGQEKYDDGYQDGYDDGYAQGHSVACNLESGQASLGSGWTSPSTVLPSSGYDGLSSVVVTDNGYGQAKYDQGYQAGHTSGYGEGYADGTSANCNTYSLLYITTDVDTGTINLYPDPTEGTGFSSVAVNLDGYGERRFQDGYREGESSVMKSLFNENDTTYVVGYYYTPTTQVCLITGEHSTQQYDGNLCFSAMSINGGAWETVQKYLQLPAGWTEIRFQVADANLYGAFAHRFTPSQTCYMDALKAVSIPSNITDLHSKYTFAYNEGIKILSMSSNSAYGMTFYNAPNINVVFSHYAGNSIYISGLPSNGVLFIPTGQSSNYSNVLTDWTHLELF